MFCLNIFYLFFFLCFKSAILLTVNLTKLNQNVSEISFIQPSISNPEKFKLSVFDRLPKSISPSNYYLSFKPDLENFTFQGFENITIEIFNETNVVTMNSKMIQISSVYFKSETQDLKSENISYNIIQEKISIFFQEPLKEGPGYLLIKFSGVNLNNLRGFYRYKYKDKEGIQKYALATQFEPIDARQAFPCWDEPSIKATFVISLTVPSDRVALSNMPIMNEEIGEKEKTITFQKSPIMSTYLVAMVVGEFDFVEEKAEGMDLKIRVYTPLGKKEQGLFALKVACKTLPFFNFYFNVSYPLPKLDLIAITDFAIGAMENWGLITYRDIRLLEEKFSSQYHKQNIARIVGHEIAHQWFGNLVTMEWWTHLWLNEGFASWIEYLCVDHCFPEFDIWTQFASSHLKKAFEKDSLSSSRPIENYVNNPDEIEASFDVISYKKGSSVIRMLHDYMGNDDFKKGMHNYLTRHQYKNTFTEDLWKSLEEASGKPINSIMSTWTKQIGFPVIKVFEEINGNSRKLILSQQKFNADGSKDSNQTWMIPITICSSSSPFIPIKKFILEKEKDEIILEKISPEDWIKLNVGGVGFYRVDYDDNMLKRLLPSIKSMVLSPRDRLSLQSDLFALSQAGYLPIKTIFENIINFQNEINPIVLDEILTDLNRINKIMIRSNVSKQVEKYMEEFLLPIFKKFGWNKQFGEEPLIATLRNTLIGVLGSIKSKEITGKGFEMFHKHINRTQLLAKDLSSSIYYIAANEGGEEEYEMLKNIYLNSSAAFEKSLALSCLGKFKEEKLQKLTFHFCLSDQVKRQDLVSCIYGLHKGYHGNTKIWLLAMEKWEELKKKSGGGLLFIHLLESFAGLGGTDNIEETEKFLIQKIKTLPKNVLQVLERLRIMRKQVERNEPALLEFFENIKEKEENESKETEERTESGGGRDEESESGGGQDEVPKTTNDS